MGFDFLTPVKEVILAHNQLLPEQAFGKNIKVHSKKRGIPTLDGAHIAILGVHESRNAYIKRVDPIDISAIRVELYRLFLGNWNSKIVDLGDIREGETVKDTYFVVTEIVSVLLKKKIIPIIIGATQDVTYPIYRSYDKSGHMVNLTSIDSRFDFGKDEELVSSESYLHRIVTDKPHNLFNYSNLGYQSYFNAQEEIDLMDKLHFDAYRLGDIIANMTIVEPVLRDTDIVSMDLRSVKASEVGCGDKFSPNGFNGREICAISRYAGISDRVSSFGIFEVENSNLSAQLVAQIIWYFIEGYNFRADEYPRPSDEELVKFIVPIEEDNELCFYKSKTSQRWWVEVPTIFKSYNNSGSLALLPCSHEDYLEACNQNIPERWLKAYKKSLN